jgi:DNA-directed RNA polymerase specialized sigma24 family protein
VPRTNQEWLNELRSDDPVVRDEATVELQDRLRRIIFSQFLAKGLSGSCIDDVVQETSFRIFQRLDTFRGDSQFMTWVTAYAVRTGMEMLRRGYWSARTGSDFLMPDNTVDLVDLWESLAPSPDVDAQRKGTSCIHFSWTTMVFLLSPIHAILVRTEFTSDLGHKVSSRSIAKLSRPATNLN